MTAPRILIVEDEADLAQTLKQGLGEEGFSAEVALTGEVARRLFTQHWDLILLDLMLPDVPGEALLKYLKQEAHYPLVLVLTARSTVEDKLSLFRSGCDDYLTKPFVFSELLERVKALLRRSPRSALPVCTYEEVELDPVNHRLTAGDRSITLTPKETAICRLLLEEPGRVITRKEILHSVWGLKEEPDTNFIGVHVFNLRKKFAQLGLDEWFRTVRSSGFLVHKPEETCHGA